MTGHLFARRRVLAAVVANAALSGCAGMALARLVHGGREGTRAGMPASSPPGGEGPDAAIARYRAATGVSSLSVRLLRGADLLYSGDFGDYRADTQICIASASKWLVGAALMVQVDKGLIALDDPVGRFVGGLPDAYAGLSIGRLASFTAGLPGLERLVEFRQPADIPLARSAGLAAEVPLATRPGTRFDYGGANLQFVGAAIEAVTDRSWHAVFEQDIASPLGMAHTLWGRMAVRPDRARPMPNPVLQAGAWTTADDYAAFLAMLANGGSYRGTRILSAGAVAAMARVRTAEVEKGFAPPGTPGRGVEYALANWCERPAGSRCAREASPGFYGTYPWIDRDSGLFGVIFQLDRLHRVSAQVQALRADLERFGLSA